MVMSTKTLTDSLINTSDDLFKTSKVNSASKSNYDLYKTDITSNRDANKSNEFMNVLNSKTTMKEKSNVNDRKADEASTKDDSKIDELNDKLKELEENSKSDSKDKAKDVLEELLNLLAGFGIKQEDLNLNGKINVDALKSIIDGIKKEQGSNGNLNSIMQKIMELLKNDSMKESLDSNSLKLMNNILMNLSDKLADDNSEAATGLKKGINKLMSEISNVLDNKQNEHTNKVLTLEDMLNKNYSQGDDDSKNLTQDESNSAANSKDNKETSKEDKFLKSLLDDNKDDATNKINLFASRTAVTQNQGGTTVRGLTINKATFTNDLIRDVKFMSNNSLKELIVKVNPGNLGEITIKLIQEDGLMKANLKADSKETTALISQNLADIKKQLSEQNIKISDVNIELYQDDTTFFKEQGFQGQLAEQNRQNNNPQKNVSARTEGIVASEELDENLAEENNNVNFFA